MVKMVQEFTYYSYYRTTVRYKRFKTVLGFGCKNQCLCKTMFINDITTLQAAMKEV